MTQDERFKKPLDGPTLTTLPHLATEKDFSALHFYIVTTFALLRVTKEPATSRRG